MRSRTTAIGGMLLLAACSSACSEQGHTPDAVQGPGLGEIMTLTQMRHAKLWLAGAAGNWELAAYELDELGEGFADSVRLHPEHKGQPVAELLPVHMNAPLEALRAAVGARERGAFEAEYDRFTAACNACHEATRFGFNRVVRPDRSVFPNQDFAPPRSR
jgi:hypothetical protein